MAPDTELPNNIKFDEIKALLQELIDQSDKEPTNISLAVLTTQVTILAATLERIVAIVYGNGKPGLITLVDISTRKLEVYDKVMWTVVGIVASLVIGSIFYLILSHGVMS